MSNFRKILKIAIVLAIIFGILTTIMAMMINFTAFKESWAYIGLLVIVSVVCIIAGYLIGTLFNSKGILVGLITSLLTVELLFLCVQLAVLGKISEPFPNILYLISVLLGTMGGVIGVNSNK